MGGKYENDGASVGAVRWTGTRTETKMKQAVGLQENALS
jgi:hypothetical protein